MFSTKDHPQKKKLLQLKGWIDSNNISKLHSISKLKKYKALLNEKFAFMLPTSTELYTPLLYAVISGFVDPTKIFLSFLNNKVNAANIDLSIKSSPSQLSLPHCAALSGNQEILNLILQIEDNSWGETAKNGDSVLHLFVKTFATSTASKQLLTSIIEKGADVDVQNEGGETALHWAVILLRSAYVSALLEKKASPSLKTQPYHETPLHWLFHDLPDNIEASATLPKKKLVSSGKLDPSKSKRLSETIFSTLLKYGVDVTCVNSRGAIARDLCDDQDSVKILKSEEILTLFLQELDLISVLPRFRENLITVDLIHQLDESSLKASGINEVGIWKRLLDPKNQQIITRLKEEQDQSDIQRKKKKNSKISNTAVTNTQNPSNCEGLLSSEALGLSTKVLTSSVSTSESQGHHSSISDFLDKLSVRRGALNLKDKKKRASKKKSKTKGSNQPASTPLPQSTAESIQLTSESLSDSQPVEVVSTPSRENTQQPATNSDEEDSETSEEEEEEEEDTDPALKHQEGSWIIRADEVTMGTKIAEGGSAIVRKGKWRGIEVAVKVLKHKTQKELGSFVDEIKLMNELRHPNILSFYGACISQSVTFVVMEFAEKGDLHSVLVAERPNWLTRVLYALHMSRGMLYLHQHKPKAIIHRDLKSMNILITDTDLAKVGDFGLSKSLEGSSALMSMGHFPTLAWAAPELVESTEYSALTDVYAYGVILWEILAYEYPWRGRSPTQLIIAVKKGDRPEIPADAECDPEYIKIMTDCWDQHPQNRPNFVTIEQRMSEVYEREKGKNNRERATLGGKEEAPPTEEKVNKNKADEDEKQED